MPCPRWGTTVLLRERFPQLRSQSAACWFEASGESCNSASLVHAAVLAIGAAATQGGAADDSQSATAKVQRAALRRKDAVMVFGATGRTGKLIVKELLDSGRSVIAACRSNQTAASAWNDLGVVEGEQAQGGGILFTEPSVDITNARTLKPGIFEGATQVLFGSSCTTWLVGMHYATRLQWIEFTGALAYCTRECRA